MPIIYIDADACPVKDETYRVAGRYGVPVVVVANGTMWVPAGVQMVVRAGFGAADDSIADVIVKNDIGAALAMRELNEERRQYGERAGGPPPMTPRDRSRFLAKLDEVVNAVIRGRS